jgi:hypothetical protein
LKIVYLGSALLSFFAHIARFAVTGRQKGNEVEQYERA